jgi:hypothetical protein
MAALEYYTADGNQVSKANILKAVSEHRAALVWAHGNWINIASLYIYETPEEAGIAYAKMETKGQCYSMAEETWTEWPTADRAVKAATGALKVS